MPHRKTKVKNRYYLVINLGLGSIRAIIFNQRREKLAQNWYPVQTLMNKDEVEQNPQEWWGLASKLLEEIFKRKKEWRENLRFITITSSSCCLVVLDKQGEPLLNSLMVSDKRSGEQAEKLRKNPNLKTIFKNPNFLPVASFMFPKILWFKERRPEIFQKAHYFMGSNDYLIYKLTGKILTDPLNAEKFYYDQKKKRYPQELLKYVGSKEKRFPRVVNFGTLAGSLKEELQKKLKLANSPKVVVSTYDAICAFLGSGASQEGEACNVCGTVSSVRAYTKKKINCQNGILSQSYADFNIVGGSNNIDGGLLEWAKNMFYGDSYPDQYLYRIMENEAQESPAGSRGLIFSPYIIGERVPFFDNKARGIFFGLERFHTRSDIMRSIFEASGFMINDIIQSIEKAGVKIKNIKMSGGMTRNKLLCKIRADITGKKVILLDEVETTSLGALLILMIKDGLFKNFREASQNFQVKAEYKPDLENHRRYKKLFSLFKKIYRSNKNLMQAREKILQEQFEDKKYILSNL